VSFCAFITNLRINKYYLTEELNIINCIWKRSLDWKSRRQWDSVNGLQYRHTWSS